jgi:hypothetical protein
MLQGEIVFVLTLKYMQCLKKAAAGLLASVEIKFEFPTRPRSPPLAPTKNFFRLRGERWRQSLCSPNLLLKFLYSVGGTSLELLALKCDFHDRPSTRMRSGWGGGGHKITMEMTHDVISPGPKKSCKMP